MGAARPPQCLGWPDERDCRRRCGAERSVSANLNVHSFFFSATYAHYRFCSTYYHQFITTHYSNILLFLPGLH